MNPCFSSLRTSPTNFSVINKPLLQQQYSNASLSLACPQVPECTPSDILYNHFEKYGLINAQGEVNINEEFPIPPLNITPEIFNLLQRVTSNKHSLLTVLQTINQSNISNTSFKFYDPTLPHFLDKIGYFHSLFNSFSIPPLPIESGSIFKSLKCKSPCKCVVTIPNSQEFIRLKHFIQIMMNFRCTIQENSLKVLFKGNLTPDITLILTLNEPSIRPDIVLDLKSSLYNLQSPIPLIINHSKPWTGIIHLLTQVTKEKNWAQLTRQYTLGKRTLCFNDTVRARRYFQEFLPVEQQGKACGIFLIKEFPQSSIDDGDTFLTLTLQFLFNTPLAEHDKILCLKTVDAHLKTLLPIKQPLLIDILKCCKASTPFSLIQSLIEITALQAILRKSNRITTSIVTIGNKFCLRARFDESRQTFLLPFNPEKALKTLKKIYHSTPVKKPFTLFYEGLIESFQTTLISDPPAQFLASHNKYKNTFNEIPPLSDDQPALLAHLDLFWASGPNTDPIINLNKKYLIKNLITTLSPVLKKDTQKNMIDFLASSQLQLPPSVLRKIIPIIEINSNLEEVKNSVIKSLLSEKRDDVKVLAYDIWLEITNTAKEYFYPENTTLGYVLFYALLKQQQWAEALKVLDRLSKTTYSTISEIILAHTKAHKALACCSCQAEKSSYTNILANQLKNTLTLSSQLKNCLEIQRPSALFDKDLPTKVSTSIFKIISHALDTRTIPLACDLYMLCVDLDLFDVNIVNVKLLGRNVFTAMLTDQTQTPYFTAYFVQYLARKKLWIFEEEQTGLTTLAEKLASHPHPETIHLLSLCIELLSPRLEMDLKKKCKELQQQLVKKIHTYNYPVNQPPLSLNKIKIESKRLEEKQNAYTLLTKPSTLAQWLTTPSLFIKASLACLEKKECSFEEKETVIKNLFMLINPEQYSDNQFQNILQHTVKLLEENQSLNVDLMNTLKNHHFLYIQVLLDKKNRLLATTFTEALNKHFQKANWDPRIGPIIFSQLPGSFTLFTLAEALVENQNEQNSQTKGAYLCSLALKALSLNKINKGILLAEQLSSLKSWNPAQINHKEKISQLIQEILTRSDNIKVPTKLARFVLQSSPTNDPSSKQLVETIANRLIEAREWNIFSRFILYAKNVLDNELGTSLAVKGIEIWLNNPEKKSSRQIITVIKKFPNISIQTIIVFLHTISPFKNSLLKKEAATMWLEVNRCNRHDSDLLTDGWIAVLSYPFQIITRNVERALLKFSPRDDYSQAENFHQKRFLTVLSLYKKKKPSKEMMKEVLTSYRKSPSLLTQEHTIQLFKILARAGMVEESLEQAFHLKEKPIPSTITEELAQISQNLKISNQHLSETIIKQLSSVTRSLSVDLESRYYLPLIKNLANIPSDSTYEAACELFHRHLNQFQQAHFRKSYVKKSGQIITTLKEQATNFQRILALNTCILHPFAQKHPKIDLELDEYIKNLLDISCNIEYIDNQQGIEALEIFTRYSQIAKEKRCDSYKQNFIMAFRLNIFLFQQTEDAEKFNYYHEKFLSVVLKSINLLRKQPNTIQMNSYQKDSLDIIQEVMKIYFLSLTFSKWKMRTSSAQIYQKILNMLENTIETKNRATLKQFMPAYSIFLRLHIDNYPKLQIFHLEKADSFFDKLCKLKREIKRKELVKLMGYLNDNYSTLLSNISSTTPETKCIINTAFNRLVCISKSLKLEDEEIHPLFNSLLLAIDPGQSEIFSLHIDQANKTLSELIKKPSFPGLLFYLESYIYLFNTFPKDPMFAKIGMGIISLDDKKIKLNIANIINRIICNLNRFNSIESLNRILCIFENIKKDLSEKHLTLCQNTLSKIFKEFQLTDQTLKKFHFILRSLGTFKHFHPSIEQNVKIAYFDAFFEAFIHLIKRAHKHHDLPSSYLSHLIKPTIQWLFIGLEENLFAACPFEYIERLISIEEPLLACKDYQTLKQILGLLVLLPKEKKLPDHQQERRALLYQRIFTHAILHTTKQQHPAVKQYLFTTTINSEIYSDQEELFNLIPAI